jgi:hypothetical protein
MPRDFRLAAVAAVVLAGQLAMAAPARGELAVGVLDGVGNALVTFDTAAPQQFTSVHPIGGLQADEQIVGLDYRYDPIGAGATPAGLFALGIVDAGATDTARLYRIDEATGAATAVSAAPIAGLDDGTDYGVDFNPAADRLRVVSDGDESMRINPNSGARSDSPTNDTNLTPASADVEAAAYDRVDADTGTPTTLYALNAADGNLVTIGGVDGSPSPNGGAVMTVGPTGVATSAQGSRNLDISPTGAAYATLVTVLGLTPGLYGASLATGALTPIGSLPASLRAFAVAPRASVQFAAAQATATEGGVATLTVTRSGALSGTATVDYAARGGSASGTDFAPADGTLTFASLETSKTIAVATSADALDEPDETVAVTLSNPNATTAVGAPAVATLTIADDDPPPAPPPPPPPPPLPDRLAPSLRVTGVPGSIARDVLLSRGVKVAVTPSEPAALECVLLGTIGTARLRATDNLTLARRTLPLRAGRRSVTLKPPRALVGRPARTVKVRLRITATDAAGNRRTVSRTIKVKPTRR